MYIYRPAAVPLRPDIVRVLTLWRTPHCPPPSPPLFRYGDLVALHEAKCSDHDQLQQLLVVAQQERFKSASALTEAEAAAAGERREAEAQREGLVRDHAEEMRGVREAMRKEREDGEKVLEASNAANIDLQASNDKLGRRAEAAEAARKMIRDETKLVIDDLRRREAERKMTIDGEEGSHAASLRKAVTERNEACIEVNDIRLERERLVDTLQVRERARHYVYSLQFTVYSLGVVGQGLGSTFVH